MSGTDRTLAAIMFTDIVGYTRMAQANEALALELLEDHKKLLRPLFPAHGGTEVKTIGDAFLVEFRSALEAVRCAVEMQKRLGERNKALPEAKKLHVRIGVHLGDVVHGSGDVFGDAVNVASRIEPLAEPGGVCISQQVYDNIRNKTELDITKMGEVELKNVELPVGVYRVNLEARRSGGQGTAPPRERLAVLPFVNISPDPNDEYFADGLTEELISKLSEIKGLKVIARTSVMNYKKKEKSVSQIGKELEAGSIIEGSVRKAGNKIRVTVQLIDSRTEEHLWASNYDKELDDIFAIQSDVASKVADSISAGILSKAPRSDTEDIEAYTLYLRGRQLYHESTETSLGQAVALFERAISKDPTFARAYASLAMAWGRMAGGGYEDFSVVVAKAEPAARKAIELDPELAEAHVAMASVGTYLDRFDQAVAEAEEAVRINPNLSEAHLTLAILYSSQRGLDDALKEFQRAYELDPLFYVTGNFVALVARMAGKMSLAWDVLSRLKETSPKNPRVYVSLAEWYMTNGDFVRAQEMLEATRQISPSEPLMLVDQGILYALTGRRREAESVLQERMKDARESARLYGQLFIQTALGNLDEAFKALERQSETHSWPFIIRYHPFFADLRKDPRYPEFASKVGLPH